MFSAVGLDLTEKRGVGWTGFPIAFSSESVEIGLTSGIAGAVGLFAVTVKIIVVLAVVVGVVTGLLEEFRQGRVLE